MESPYLYCLAQLLSGRGFWPIVMSSTGSCDGITLLVIEIGVTDLIWMLLKMGYFSLKELSLINICSLFIKGSCYNIHHYVSVSTIISSNISSIFAVVDVDVIAVFPI